MKPTKTLQVNGVPEKKNSVIHRYSKLILHIQMLCPFNLTKKTATVETKKILKKKHGKVQFQMFPLDKTIHNIRTFSIKMNFYLSVHQS